MIADGGEKEEEDTCCWTGLGVAVIDSVGEGAASTGGGGGEGTTGTGVVISYVSKAALSLVAWPSWTDAEEGRAVVVAAGVGEGGAGVAVAWAGMGAGAGSGCDTSPASRASSLVAGDKAS
jgi:hypothetical protein